MLNIFHIKEGYVDERGDKNKLCGTLIQYDRQIMNREIKYQRFSKIKRAAFNCLIPT